MDKKRNILIREMMELIDQAKDIQAQIDETFRTAYAALQKANMELGIAFVQQVSYTVPVEDSVRIKTRSVWERAREFLASIRLPLVGKVFGSINSHLP